MADPRLKLSVFRITAQFSFHLTKQLQITQSTWGLIFFPSVGQLVILQTLSTHALADGAQRARVGYKGGKRWVSRAWAELTSLAGEGGLLQFPGLLQP